MSNSRYRPQARKNLYSWRYYNDHFNVDRLQPLPPLSEQPPPYKITHQHHDYNKKPPEQIKKPEQKVHSFLDKCFDAFDHYCDTSSLHGLKYVGENRFSKPERFFWFISFLIAVFSAIFFISNLFINYNNNPVIVGFRPEMMDVQNVPFPAITICNTNIALRRRAERIARYGTPTEKHVLDDLCSSEPPIKDPEDIGSISWQTMESVIMNTTQKCSEMIVGCKLQEKTYKCGELFNSVLMDDGYCCSFNKLPNSYIYKLNLQLSNATVPSNVVNWYPEGGYPANARNDAFPYRAFGIGVEQGLTLVLNADLREYYCSTESCFGFKILFHTPRESPLIKELGYLIQPGVETRVSMNADVIQADDSIRGIDYRKRNCFFTFEKFLRYYKIYSEQNCLLECEANYTVVKCGCTPYYLPRDSNRNICGKSDNRCVNEAKFVIQRVGPEKIACECLPGCSTLSYNPNIKSSGSLLNINNITYAEFLGNYSQQYFAENMAVVHFYFGVDRFQVQVKTAMYGFSAFLSNTGGLLGLFLGFGVLSVVEIIYFLLIRGACVWCQNRNNKTANQQVFVT